MKKIRKTVCCAALCATVMAQTAFAEQIQVEFYGETTANKQISVLALDKDLPDSEVNEQNIKYINQISADSDGGYSIKFPFETDGDGCVFRSNESGEVRQIGNEKQIQLVFYGKTTANKQISVLALDKDLSDSEIKGRNIKYINQISANADGYYSIAFPFETDGGKYVFRSNEAGVVKQIESEGQSLYVSESGSDLNDGSEGSPLQTLNRALSMAISGVNTTIVLKRDAAIESLPSLSSGSITIEGDYNSRGLTLPETLECNSDIKLDKLKLSKSTLFANGHKLEIGNEVTSDDRLTVYGGGNGSSVNGDTNIGLYGGKYDRVYGGPLNAAVNGNTNITFGGNCNPGDGINDSNSAGISPCYIYGGGNNGGVSEKTNVTLDGNAVTKYIVGSGSGWGGSVGESTNIIIKGGKVMNVYAGSAASAPTLNCNTNITMTGGIAEALFGGSEGTNLTGNAHLYLLGGEVTRRIFSGCYNGTNGWFFISIASTNHIKGTTTIVIDDAAKLITKNGLSSGNRMNSGIFAGSRIASKNAEEVNTLIFLNDSYNSKKSLVGDISGWSDVFKSFETYTIKVSKGGSVDAAGNGVISLKPDMGMAAQIGGKTYGAENVNVSSGTTEVKFVKDFSISSVTADKTNNTASVDYTATNYESEPEPKLFVAVYEKQSDNSKLLVKVNASECTNGTTAAVNLGDDLEAGKTYIIKAMMFNKNQQPLTNYYEINY